MDEKNIKCPECGKDMEKGFVTATDNSILNLQTLVTWHPDSEKGKLLKTHGISLRIKGTGYYCDECMKVFAVFEER